MEAQQVHGCNAHVRVVRFAFRPAWHVGVDVALVQHFTTLNSCCSGYHKNKFSHFRLVTWMLSEIYRKFKISSDWPEWILGKRKALKNVYGAKTAPKVWQRLRTIFYLEGICNICILVI